MSMLCVLLILFNVDSTIQQCEKKKIQKKKQSQQLCFLFNFSSVRSHPVVRLINACDEARKNLTNVREDAGSLGASAIVGYD